MTRQTDNQSGTVRSVDRAIDILRCFSDDEDLRLGEISQRVALPKSTVHRLIASLEQAHLIEQDIETGKYCLGYEIIRLGRIARENMALCRVIRPEMERLSQQAEQTVNLYVRRGFERLCIDQVEGPQYIKRYSFLGALHPLYCGASGKVMLAYSTPEFLETFFASVSLEPMTPNTITDPLRLRQELGEIRMRGYARSTAERDIYSASISAPIVDSSRRLVAALTISGPLSSLTPDAMEQRAAMLTDVCKRVSTHLSR